MDYILSVVLPTYNTEKYLERCVNSLLDERINSLVEIIIVNDGSTDNSLSIARRYEEKYPFVVVIDKPNGGHGSTINKGIEVARGKYFRVLDSDDWFNTEHFVQYVKELQDVESDVVVTWGYYEYVYNNKQLPYTLWEDDRDIEYGQVYDFDSFDFKGKFIVMAQLTYLTSIVKQMPRKIQENTFYVDNEFVLYPMLNVSTLVFLNYYIYHYFIGRPEQSMNKKVLRRNIEHCKRVGLAITSFLKDSNAGPAKKKYMHLIAIRIVRTYYTYLLSYFHWHRYWAYRLLKEWDAQLKQDNLSLYHDLQEDVYIKLYRKFSLLGVVVSPFLYSFYLLFKRN